MAYVMLTSIQSLEQLIILEFLVSGNIYANNEAKTELNRIEFASINKIWGFWKEDQIEF